jgi:tetratricopeptide (TPR) repeat protein
MQQDLEGALSTNEGLLNLYRKSGQPREAINALVQMANQLHHHGQAELSAQMFERTMHLCQDENLASSRQTVLHDYSGLLYCQGRTAEAIDCSRKSVELSKQEKAPDQQSRMLSTLGYELGAIGEVQEAESACDGAIDLALRSKNQGIRAHAQFARATVAWTRGDRDKAHSLMEDALAALGPQPSALRTRALLKKAAWTCEAGDLESAHALLQDPGVLTESTSPHDRAEALRVRIQILAESGDIAQAYSLLQSPELAAMRPLAFQDALNEAAEGVVAMHAREYSQAIAHLENALASFEASRFMRYAACAYRDLVIAYQGIGEHSQAGRYREKAALIFRRLGDGDSADRVAAGTK